MIDIAGMRFKDMFLRHNICLPATQYVRNYWIFGNLICFWSSFLNVDKVENPSNPEYHALSSEQFRI
jgi:hypothetical protein